MKDQVQAGGISHDSATASDSDADAVAVGQIPPEQFGQAHWSLLAFVHASIVNIGRDKIRWDRLAANPRKERPLANALSRVMPYDPDRDGTKRKDGSVAPGHDDWDSLDELRAAGFLHGPLEGIQLTERGWAAMGALQRYRAESGGQGADASFDAAPFLHP